MSADLKVMAYDVSEAIEDVTRIAEYLHEILKNKKVVLDFLDHYNEEIKRLESFPFGYRGYEIRSKPFNTYNVFFSRYET